MAFIRVYYNEIEQMVAQSSSSTQYIDLYNSFLDILCDDVHQKEWPVAPNDTCNTDTSAYLVDFERVQKDDVIGSDITNGNWLKCFNPLKCVAFDKSSSTNSFPKNSARDNNKKYYKTINPYTV